MLNSYSVHPASGKVMLDLGNTANGVADYLACIALSLMGVGLPCNCRLKKGLLLEVDNSLLIFNLV
jgi:hypothetical protein